MSLNIEVLFAKENDTVRQERSANLGERCFGKILGEVHAYNFCA